MTTEEKREKEGFVAAMKQIEKDGDTVEAAQKHLADAEADAFPDAFTTGWIRACKKFIEANKK